MDGGPLSILFFWFFSGGLNSYHGVVVERHEGAPQGGPLSPLLTNALLDEVDKEMEKRGHAFCRYADDSAPRRRGEEAIMAN